MGKKGNQDIRILLTGGGSGGHVQPLLAIADALKEAEPDVKLLYVGVRQGLEATIVPREKIPLRFSPSCGMPTRPISLGMLKFIVTLFFGILKSIGTLILYRPHAIVASGGFASAPTVFAATWLAPLSLGLWKIPIYMHEQNAVPGRMNRFAGRFVTRIGVSHSRAVKGFSTRAVEVVGYPVRSGFKTVSREEARRKLELEDKDIYVLVTGGSQGARTINRTMVDALPYLAKRKNLKIKHASGRMNNSVYRAQKDTKERLASLDSVPEFYELVDYLHDMPVHLAAADIAVVRGGAGSIIETCSSGIPALVIPKANLPGDSQVANARELEAEGAIEILYEEPAPTSGKLIEFINGKSLADRILRLADDPEARSELSKRALKSADRGAAKRVAKCVLRLARSITSLDMDDVTPLRTHLVVNSSRDDLSEKPSTTLRRYVEKSLKIQFESAFSHGRISDTELAELREIDYIRYRGAALLVQRSWKLRNEGVKLIGLTRHEDKIGLLTHLIVDRSPAPAHHRLLGGDYVQVGFIRRNSLASLALIGVYDDRVIETVGVALSDPYYEVRVSALQMIRLMVINGFQADISFSSAINNLTNDSSLEVQWEAIHTFGCIGVPEEVLDSCRKYSFSTSVRLREASLKAYHALLDRIPENADSSWIKKLENDLNNFAITSVAFQPHFPLKKEYVSLLDRIRKDNRS
jgi:UDP-N-acetylglucosamine--N-acetylmuramyl-(pentapeptide) pyrophosphoryl-undecaprenol N-acetylglucosamine transferase